LSLSLPSSRVEFCFTFEDPAWLHPKPKEKAMGLKEYQELCMYSAVSFLELHTDFMRPVTWIWIIRLEVECAGFYAGG
jgi:hypothetical protein